MQSVLFENVIVDNIMLLQLGNFIFVINALFCFFISLEDDFWSSLIELLMQQSLLLFIFEILMKWFL